MARPQPGTTPLPSASAVLRRALILWGLGHVALGDRRGWLLAVAHPLAVIGLLAFAAVLIQGTRWMLVFPALVLFIVFWFGQALNAHRRAIALGAAPGGELQIAFFLPIAVALVTGFWLLGGSAGSPAATLRLYVSAWEEERPEVATALFANPADPAGLAVLWTAQDSYLRERATDAAELYGPQSGIDPDEPFNSLRFSELPETGADIALVDVQLVRRQRVETVLLGFIPTATQQTVVVDELGTVRLRALPATQPSWLPSIRTGARMWRIDSVDIATGS